MLKKNDEYKEPGHYTWINMSWCLWHVWGNICVSTCVYAIICWILLLRLTSASTSPFWVIILLILAVLYLHDEWLMTRMTIWLKNRMDYKRLLAQCDHSKQGDSTLSHHLKSSKVTKIWLKKLSILTWASNNGSIMHQHLSTKTSCMHIISLYNKSSTQPTYHLEN